MRKSNAALGVFLITFILLGTFTTLFYIQITDELKIPHSIEADYFDANAFNPAISSPSRIIDMPDEHAYPQSRYNHIPTDFNITRGGIRVNGRETTRNDFIERIYSSDDEYGEVIPTTISYQTSSYKNYYPFVFEKKPLIAQRAFMLPLSPNLDHYLAFDNVFNTSKSVITDDTKLHEMRSRINVANNPYLMPDTDTYLSIESNNDDHKILTVEFETGGVSIFNESLYRMYTTLDNNRELILNATSNNFEYNLFLDIYSDNPSVYYEFYLFREVINAKDRSFFRWFAEKCFSYYDFCISLGYDFEEGYKVFVNFNPQAITNIGGKIAIYIDTESGNPTVNGYIVQAWNYLIESWVDVIVRTEGAIKNNWLYDSFNITLSENPWQYINYDQDTYLKDSNFIKWRVITNADATHELPIKIRIGGLWTSVIQEFIDFELEMKFKVDDPAITKNDLFSTKLIVEYHTEGWNSLSDLMVVTQDIGNIPYTHTYYDPDLGQVRTKVSTAKFKQILEGGSLYASSVRDNLMGVMIPENMIDSNTEVTVTIAGIFPRYSIEHGTYLPKIRFDKIAMQYEYTKPIDIKKKAWLNYNSLDTFYWSYDIQINNNLVYLEFEYPKDWIFIDQYFALVENLDIQKNVSYLWIDSLTNKHVDRLYDSTYIRFDSRAMFFLGSGLYRFWFRSRNYITNFTIMNSTHYQYNTGDAIKMNETTIYDIQLNRNWLNANNKQDCDGAMEVSFIGNNKQEEKLYKFGPFNGTQYNVTENNRTYWNYWQLNFTHEYSHNMYGHIQIECLWYNLEYNKIGLRIFWLYISYTSDAKPIISIVEPEREGRWGANQTNYITVASWHLNTEYVWCELDGIRTNMTNLDYAIKNNKTVPLKLRSVAGYLQKFYWFSNVDTSAILEKHSPEQSSNVKIEFTVGSVAGFEGEAIESDEVKFNVNIISSFQVKLNPVFNIKLNEKPKIIYECPEGINKMDVYIKMDENEILISEIGDVAQSKSFYLNKGVHSYVIPYRVSMPGVYTIVLKITDDVENVIIVESNEFTVIDDDDRLWITKVLDESLEIIILWSAYFSAGVIYIKKTKKTRRINWINLNEIVL